jgi:hypothetical protein
MSDDSVDSLIRQLERLRLQEALVLQRLIAARQRENSRTNEPTNEPEREAFRVGGRITINNPNTRFGRAVNSNDRRAIISKVTATRVYYKTLNGTTTWRARSNLTIVDPEVTWSDDE